MSTLNVKGLDNNSSDYYETLGLSSPYADNYIKSEFNINDLELQKLSNIIKDIGSKVGIAKNGFHSREEIKIGVGERMLAEPKEGRIIFDKMSVSLLLDKNFPIDVTSESALLKKYFLKLQNANKEEDKTKVRIGFLENFQRLSAKKKIKCMQEFDRMYETMKTREQVEGSVAHEWGHINLVSPYCQNESSLVDENGNGCKLSERILPISSEIQDFLLSIAKDQNKIRQRLEFFNMSKFYEKVCSFLDLPLDLKGMCLLRSWSYRPLPNHIRKGRLNEAYADLFAAQDETCRKGLISGFSYNSECETTKCNMQSLFWGHSVESFEKMKSDAETMDTHPSYEKRIQYLKLPKEEREALLKNIEKILKSDEFKTTDKIPSTSELEKMGIPSYLFT